MIAAAATGAITGMAQLSTRLAKEELVQLAR